MKIKLSPSDVLQLSRAVKSGCLDTGKISGLRAIADSYKPKKVYNDYDALMLKKYIRLEWLIELASFEDWKKKVYNELPDDTKKYYAEKGGAKQLYIGFLYNIVLGFLSLKAVGCTLNLEAPPEPDKAKGVLDEYIRDRYNTIVYFVAEVTRKYELVPVEGDDEDEKENAC